MADEAERYVRTNDPHADTAISRSQQVLELLSMPLWTAEGMRNAISLM